MRLGIRIHQNDLMQKLKAVLPQNIVQDEQPPEVSFLVDFEPKRMLIQLCFIRLT